VLRRRRHSLKSLITAQEEDPKQEHPTVFDKYLLQPTKWLGSTDGMLWPDTKTESIAKEVILNALMLKISRPPISITIYERILNLSYERSNLLTPKISVEIDESASEALKSKTQTEAVYNCFRSKQIRGGSEFMDAVLKHTCPKFLSPWNSRPRLRFCIRNEANITLSRCNSETYHISRISDRKQDFCLLRQPVTPTERGRDIQSAMWTEG